VRIIVQVFSENGHIGILNLNANLLSHFQYIVKKLKVSAI